MKILLAHPSGMPKFYSRHIYVLGIEMKFRETALGVLR